MSLTFADFKAGELVKQLIETFDCGGFTEEERTLARLAARRLEAQAAVLTECEKHLSEWLREFGGCDHAVSVCSCAEQALLAKVREALCIAGFRPEGDAA